MQDFATSGHLVFRCSTPLSTSVLKSLGGGRHFPHIKTQSSEMRLKTIAAESQVTVLQSSGTRVHWQE